MKTSKDYSKNGNNEAEDINDPKLAKINLFFIKSKHAFRHYKNHDYFQDKKDILAAQEANHRQFVLSSAPYGINNTYDYICEEISKNYLRKNKTTQKKFRTFHERYDEENRISENCHYKRKTHFTLPNLAEAKKQQKLEKKVFRQETDINNRLNDSLNIRSYEKAETLKARNSYFINLVYVDGSSASNLHSFQLKLDIYTYIVNTFLKTRVNYSQLSDEEFSFIICKILQIYETDKEYMEYKDLVNFKTTRQIFDILNTYSGKQIETRQILRYFFVSKQQIYEYQFNRIKDQLKDRLRFQFKNSPKSMEIFMYDPVTGTQITNLFQLIKFNKSKFIFGIRQNILPMFRKYTQDQTTKRHLANRITKWKGIISDKTVNEVAFRPMTQQKYQLLFDNAQKKRVAFNRNKKKCEISLKNSQFINRQSLFKDENIFQ